MASKNTLSALSGLRDLSIAPGAVFLGPWAEIDHEKFLVIASGMLTVEEMHSFFGVGK